MAGVEREGEIRERLVDAPIADRPFPGLREPQRQQEIAEAQGDRGIGERRPKRVGGDFTATHQPDGDRYREEDEERQPFRANQRPWRKTHKRAGEPDQPADKEEHTGDGEADRERRTANEPEHSNERRCSRQRQKQQRPGNVVPKLTAERPKRTVRSESGKK